MEKYFFEPDYRFKANLLLFALCRDYFAYGTYIEKRKDGKYNIYCDGEKTTETLHDLANDYDTLSNEEKSEILELYNDLIIER